MLVIRTCFVSRSPRKALAFVGSFPPPDRSPFSLPTGIEKTRNRSPLVRSRLLRRTEYELAVVHAPVALALLFSHPFAPSPPGPWLSDPLPFWEGTCSPSFSPSSIGRLSLRCVRKSRNARPLQQQQPNPGAKSKKKNVPGRMSADATFILFSYIFGSPLPLSSLLPSGNYLL